MMPFFSVIIPLYNKEDFIEDTLESVLNQTFTDYEVVIINDGSTDNSLNIVKRITKKLKNIFIINQENKGLSATRNKGISISKGDIIALLDADDVWHKSFLNEIYNLHNKFPEASLYGTDHYQKYNDKNILESKKNINKALKGKSFLIEDFFKANLFHLIISQSNFAVKKHVFDDIKFNESLDYAEDLDFYIASSLKYKFAYCYKALATINFNNPNQMTQIGFKGKRIPNLDIYENEASTNISLKKFLDYNRYFFMIPSRLSGDEANYKLMSKNLDINNLTLKQKILLKSPLILLKAIKSVKRIFLKYNIRPTSF